jgi:O6-methylguanine-DNA--protein-cysteine methyltransferase
MQREIDELESRLHRLRQASGGANARLPIARRVVSALPAKARRRRITAEQRASRVIQGRYLGLIRQIPAGRRGQYQKIAREKGREAAIKEMANALGK